VSEKSEVVTFSTGSQYQYQVVAKDPENGQLSYVLKNAPTGMVIDAGTGLITWDNPIVGNHQIVVTVIDGAGMGVAQGYTLMAKANIPSLSLSER
jgi:large repetitive protein